MTQLLKSHQLAANALKEHQLLRFDELPNDMKNRVFASFLEESGGLYKWVIDENAATYYYEAGNNNCIKFFSSNEVWEENGYENCLREVRFYLEYEDSPNEYKETDLGFFNYLIKKFT